MKTVVLEEPGRFQLTDSSTPAQIGPDEALVRVCRVGICGTDLHAYRGDQPFFSYPRILGHELGVEVIRVGENNHDISAGDRCAVEPYLNCGTCIACRRGKPNCCTTLKVLGVHQDGGMRESIKVPIRKLHQSASLTLEQLALVETLGIGAHAVGRAQVQADENVLVVGAGPIGLSVVQFAGIAGAKLAVMDISPNRLEFCSRQFAVERTILLGEQPVKQIESVFAGELPTAVFDATGNPQSMISAFNYTASGGRLTLVGLVQAEITFADPEFHRRELTLLATRNATSHDFRRIIELMEAGRIETTPWITHRASLEEMIGRFDGWLDPQTGVIKAMVKL